MYISANAPPPKLVVIWECFNVTNVDFMWSSCHHPWNDICELNVHLYDVWLGNTPFRSIQCFHSGMKGDSVHGGGGI